MQVQAYLSFDGRCDEALTFYRNAVGAEVKSLMRFNEMPGGLPPGMVPPGCEDKVMHSEMLIGETTVMASDGKCTNTPNFSGTSLALIVADDAEAARVFNALADGGAVQMALAKTFFSSSFGMLTDRFGVPWMVVVA